MDVLLLKKTAHFAETLYCVASELGKTLFRLLHCLLSVEVCLREELVGIAYQFLLHCLRHKTCVRQRQVLFHYVVECESGSGVAFAYSCIILRQTLFSKYFGTAHAVSDVRFGAVAFYSWCICEHDAYVVKHCSITHKVGVDV